MRVCNYLEGGSLLEQSGISTAAAHHRQALREAGPEITLLDHPLAHPAHQIPACLAGRKSPVADYDIAHCHAIGPGSLAVARHAKRTGRPLVLHAHVTAEDFADSFRGSSLGARPLRRYLRWFYSQADLVCTPSGYTASVLEAYPVEAPIKPVTNGVDLAALEGHDTLRDVYRERYDLEGVVVFAVGNVFERKGVETFCRLGGATDSRFAFVWFGPYDRGPFTSSVVKRLTENPPSNVTFTGWVEDKRGAFGAGDIFCFPTHVENQGIAVLEAMACGKPVVLRRIPVFEELYTHGKDCLLCSTRAEFQEALEALAADPELRATLGANARQTAESHRLERVGEQLTAWYRQLHERVDGGGLE